MRSGPFVRARSAPVIELVFTPSDRVGSKTNTPWEAPRFFKSIDVNPAERDPFHLSKLCVTHEADGAVARLSWVMVAPNEKPATAGPGGLWVVAARRGLAYSRLHARSQQKTRAFRLRAARFATMHIGTLRFSLCQALGAPVAPGSHHTVLSKWACS